MTEVLHGIAFARETLSPELAKEVQPLIERHFRDVDPFPEFPLDPDWEGYYTLQAADLLRIFTARDSVGALIGYSVAFVRTDLHHRTSKRATQDVFFIKPGCRGFGMDFLLWCNEQLKAECVQIAFQHVSVNHDWGKMAAKAGFTQVETTWAKVL